MSTDTENGSALMTWGWMRSPAALRPASLRLLVDFPEGRAPIFQPGGAMSLSPDGSRLVYTGGGRRAGGSDSWRLWIRPLDRMMADSVPGSEQAHSPAWSGAGDSVVFVVGGEIRVFSTLPGEGVATIRRGDAIAYGVSWSPESGILFTTSAGLLPPARSTASRLVKAWRACSPNESPAGSPLSGSIPG